MQNKTVFIILCILLVFLILLYTYILYDPNNELYSFVKENQIIKHPYIRSREHIHTPIVPLKLFQTWHTKNLPPKMQEATERIQKSNPELEYCFFDESDCVDFIQTHFSDEVVNAFHTLLPGAYKADLWRYCVMYIHGGVYLDIKYQCVDGFKLIDIMDKEHFVLERPHFWEPDSYGIYNALIIAKPNNPIFFKCIQRIVKNVQYRYYGYNSLYPTGPGLLGELYFGNINKNVKQIHHFDLFFNMIDNHDVIIYKNQIILQSYPEYRKEQKLNETYKHYTVSWYQKSIYRNT